MANVPVIDFKGERPAHACRSFYIYSCCPDEWDGILREYPSGDTAMTIDDGVRLAVVFIGLLVACISLAGSAIALIEKLLKTPTESGLPRCSLKKCHM